MEIKIDISNFTPFCECTARNHFKLGIVCNAKGEWYIQCKDCQKYEQIDNTKLNITSYYHVNERKINQKPPFERDYYNLNPTSEIVNQVSHEKKFTKSDLRLLKMAGITIDKEIENDIQ